MGTAALRLSAAVKTYGGAPVLDGLDLTIASGQRLAVLGPSGTGKSTLLRVLAGLEPLDAGRVEADPDTTIATVFQQPLLLPWLTVRENVALGGRYRGNRSRFDPEWTEHLLGLFGLAALGGAYPDQLSGGQAQRAAVARALAIRPRVLLLDEPFGALDPATRQDLQRWLRDTVGELALTLVVVTHDVDEALYLADSIVLLDGTGGLGQRWASEPPADHDALAGHPLRARLLAGYRSQLGPAPTGVA
ncbi:ABC transporter ATP-binding protein [Amycolatopsis granulosa]|uniref:ABC transporter ATP-binding protein n=1 Tax=Amycolatopsis granulosa TaxID=185684 RepID=UPI0014243B0D|nr:ATP-binding cassette domain-containing protein [Amycolatopsis granulosa]NIH84012.1 ABC-type nitrate/sulfonate/bicarbonate transport system ATPase subunit [Amycolatopsis granulosa]